MFSDPITFKVDGGDQPHTRTALGAGVGEFSWTDPATGQVARKVTVKQTTTTKRFRREVRVANSHISPDPLTSNNAEIGMSVYLVIDEPRYGYSDVQLQNAVSDLASFLTSSSGANTLRVLGGEY